MTIRSTFLIMLLCFAATSCEVGKDYVKPSTEKPAAFKEAKDWKQAQPKDDVIRGNWWKMFNDPELNKLEDQVAISNQNIKLSEAQYRQARALVSEARAGYYPTVGGNIGMSRNGVGAGKTGTISDQYAAALDASWVPDLWGGIRRQVEANVASARASAADLANAKLVANSELAIDYLDLRIADEQKRLLDDTVKNYERSVQLTENLYNAGVAARSDVLQAKTQLETAQAQAVDVGVQRASLEHAIALLIGKAPADFSIASIDAVPTIPTIPLSVPSEVLERRPDVAGAERRVIAANAQIGVAEAAYYPNLTLAASGGYQSTSLANWFSLPNRIWSLGPNLVGTLFDGGLIEAQNRAAVAVYDQTVATYRQTVLGAFQEVEDNLASLRILEQEAGMEQKAVDDATLSATVSLNQYKSGIVSYLSVITAQNTELSNRLTALNINKARLTAAVTLIEDLGGGWK